MPSFRNKLIAHIIKTKSHRIGMGADAVTYGRMKEEHVDTDSEGSWPWGAGGRGKKRKDPPRGWWGPAPLTPGLRPVRK